ncbi:MAG: PAS domain S-box protein [Gemmatimonadales bacterium]
MNLLASVELAIVTLGPDLRIRRFTPLAATMLNLIAADVGRPITTLRLNVDVPDLEAALRRVRDTGQSQEREVHDRDGRWYSLRLRPYRMPDNRIAGALLVLVEIDSLKRTAESLRAAEERLRVAFDNAPVGVFETDLAGRFERVNGAFCRLVLRTPDELMRIRSQDITHPDDVDADRDAFERIRSGAEPAIRMEKRYLRQDGRPLWVEVHRFPVTGADGHPQHTVGIVQDIEERKNAEAAMQRREARFRAVMDGAPALIWMSGPNGTEYVNKASLDFVGADASEVAGAAWLRFIHPEDRHACTDAYARAVARLQPFEVQFRFRRADGEYRWMMSVALPRFGSRGEFTGYTGSAFDITNLKRAEESLRDADRRKDEFIALLGHELRNPLAPMTNVVELLRSPQADQGTMAWAHDVLERQLCKMQRLVNDLLDVSRVAQGKIELQLERIPLGTVLDKALEAMRPEFDARQREVVMELPAAPISLDADPVRLEQVFVNLLHNAVKFTRENGHITITAREEPGDRTVTVRVADDGIGIAPDVLPRIFDLFAQADTSLERGEGGLGVGLTLARRLVELHGGDIRARSEGRDRGSEFLVVLPLAVGPTPASTAAAADSTTAAGDARRILLVDDNVDAVSALGTLLRQAGHAVEVVHSGAAALAAAPTFGPDIALVDIGMPGMNGFEVARRLRSASPALWILAVSGYGTAEMRGRARDAGFDDYLTKPLDWNALEQLVRRPR